MMLRILIVAVVVIAALFGWNFVNQANKPQMVASELESTSPQVRLYLQLERCMAKKDYKCAKQQFQVIASSPEFRASGSTFTQVDTYMLAGIVHIKLKEYDQAGRYYQQALSLLKDGSVQANTDEYFIQQFIQQEFLSHEHQNPRLVFPQVQDTQGLTGQDLTAKDKQRIIDIQKAIVLSLNGESEIKAGRLQNANTLLKNAIQILDHYPTIKTSSLYHRTRESYRKTLESPAAT